MNDFMSYKFEGSPEGFLQDMKKQNRTESAEDKFSAVLAAKLLERLNGI